MSPSHFPAIESAFPPGSNQPSRFFDLLSRAADNDLDPFLEEVDQSDYSLSDWVDAMITFDDYLSTQNVEARPFATMTGYVRCCTEMNAPQISLPILKVIVYQSLTKYGFDATDATQI